MMTPDVVQERLAAIAACVDDPEAAHGMEDQLHADVLGAIASWNVEDATECARLALSSFAINFPRWCA